MQRLIIFRWSIFSRQTTTRHLLWSAKSCLKRKGNFHFHKYGDREEENKEVNVFWCISTIKMRTQSSWLPFPIILAYSIESHPLVSSVRCVTNIAMLLVWFAAVLIWKIGSDNLQTSPFLLASLGCAAMFRSMFRMIIIWMENVLKNTISHLLYEQ